MGLRTWLGLRQPRLKQQVVDSPSFEPVVVSQPRHDSFAQYGEDRILFRAVGHIEDGFYIDVGAMHPDEMSVTRLFYERGWSGINIEPVPKYFALLTEHRPRDINLQMAASNSEGSMDLHVMDNGLSTSDVTIAQSHATRGYAAETITVPARTLASICAQHRSQGDIHFLKIDVEGAEVNVIQGCDFARFRPWVMAIEATVPATHTPCYEGWEPIVLAAGYEFALAADINRYYIARERSRQGISLSA